MLAESVNFLNNYRQHGASGPNQSVYACRAFLARVVENFLSDPSKVSVSLKKDGSNSECYAPLQFCDIFLRDRQEVFLPAPPSHSQNTPPLHRPENTDKEEEYTHSFLLWFLSRILMLLGHGSCSAIHGRTLDVVAHMLQTVRARDLYLYGVVLKELVFCVSDLVGICEDLTEGRRERARLARFEVHMDKVLNSLQEPSKRGEESEISLSPARLEVGSLDACDLLQLNLTRILSGVSASLNKQHFQPSIVHALWACLCCQLEFGDAPLKTESLHILCSMMRHQTVPPEVEDYFLDVITALMELLCSGPDCLEKSHAQDLERAAAAVYHIIVARGNQNDYFLSSYHSALVLILTKPIHAQDLERAAADVYHMLVARGNQNDYFLSSYHSALVLILTKLGSTLTTHGLARLQTRELRWSLSGLVCDVQDRLPAHCLLGAACKSQRNQLIAALIGEVGSGTDLQFLVQPLVKAVICDLAAATADDLGKPTPLQRRADTQASTQSTSGKRKRKLDDDTPKVTRPQSLSITCKVLRSRLDKLLDEEAQGELCERLEAVRVILEVVASCVAHYSSSNAGNQAANRYKSEFARLVLWLDTECLHKVCGFLFTSLQWLAQAGYSRPELNACVTTALGMVGTLLSVQDCTDYEQDMYQTFGWVSSLPWLLNDPSWQDLKPANAREIVKISDKLLEHVVDETIAVCLEVLALLPKEVASKWRVHVYRQALGESKPVVKRAAISAFPVLLYHLGPNANHLVYDLLHPCVEEKSSLVHTALSGVAGPLACVVSRKAILNRLTAGNVQEQLYKKVKISCMTCDCSDHKDVGGSPRERPRLVDANMFLPFVQLVQSGEVKVKVALVRSMKRIYGHLGVRKNNATTINVLNTSLKLLEDPSYDVRREFSEIIQYMLGDVSSESTDNTSKLVVGQLNDAFDRAQTSGHSRTQETILLTITQLGRVAEGELLVVVILVLLESMLSPTLTVAEVAYAQLKSIAKHKKTGTQNLFMRCRQAVCKFLVDAMHKAALGKMSKTPETILLEVAQVLGFTDTKAFISGTEKYLVPYLVSKGTQAASGLVKMIATQLSVASRSKLLLNNTKYVFSYLVRYKPREADLQGAITYLQSETGFELRALLRIDFQRVHNELLMHLGTHYSEVFRGLKILSLYDENYKGVEISSSEDMAAYLEPRILGVLSNFDSTLLNASVPMEEKRPALESLIQIIRLMGSKIISGIRHKIMNTLRIGLQFTDHASIETSCRAWNCFVRSLEMTFLGQMLSQIVATLLPLLKQLPKQVAEIFNFMIVENRQALKAHFHDIYFLPDMPELNDANAVLKNYTDGPSSHSDFKSKLVHCMRGIQHESLDIRQHALSKLKKLLKSDRQAFSQLVMENETANPVVSKLISVLLKGCREQGPAAQRLYAECLGYCSAIDPGRLELSTNNPKADKAKFHTSILDDNFAVALISEVVKSFLAATEPRIQDCSAYALQELLATYKIAESGADASVKMWRKFPEHIQEILIPLLTSRYILKTNNDWSQLVKPVYHSKKGSNFKDWVSTWTGYLSSQVASEGKSYKVFESCSAVIKFDTHIALYILPYVTLHVLQDASETKVDEICAEINEVLDQVTRTDKQKGSSSDLHHMSAQTIFSVLDYLTRWKHFRAEIVAAEKPQNKGTASYLSDRGYITVSEFLARIPQDKLATASFCCKAYTRALMYFEQYLRDKPQLSKEDQDFMQRLYVELDEPDGVLGVAAIRQAPPTLQEQILTYSGRLGCQIELQTCYEQAIQGEPDDVRHHEGLLRCLMDLSQPAQALHHATGVMAKRKAWCPQLTVYQVEAAWKLGTWTDLQSFIKADKLSRGWPVLLGRILLAAKDKQEEEFLQQLQIARKEQIGPLSAASMEIGSYQRGYEYIVRLHILNEIEDSMKSFLNLSSPDQPPVSKQDLLDQWQSRLKMMQSSFRIQEPVLTLRRSLMTLAQQERGIDLDREIGHCWLHSAKIAQNTGYLQTASSFLLQASEFKLPEFGLQKAKWHWEKGEHDQALSLLEREMSVHFGNVAQVKADTSTEGKLKRQVYAKALLLYGRYSEETSKMESNAIVKQYKEVIEVAPEWEDGYFHLGKYFDRIMNTLIEDKEDISRQGEFVVHVVRNLGLSLRHGNQYIYQSLPRMLSLWMDFGSAVVEQEKREKTRPSSSTSQTLPKNRMNLNKLNQMIGTSGKTLAPYQLFFAFSQLISRICHTHTEVFLQLKAIIARLVVSFPQQALWLLMAVSKSSYNMRAKRCQEIFNTAREMSPSLAKVIQDHIKLTERLLELSEKECAAVTTLSITQHFRPLKRLLDDSNFSQILLPLQSSMTVTLATKVEKDKKHNAFPGNLVYIKGFDDVIEILPSLQKPKKITMVGSDGRLYVMMCKPKDDLRKDCRLMEFNGIVNKFLRKDPESRQRNLHIRTYTVIPLNEECGLIEWVNNTSGLRHILLKLYKEKGIYTTGKELKAMMPALQSTKEAKVQVYKQKLLPRHPPVFGEWFLRTFPDPTSWYNARLAYCKTSAVMCMVGYILGLGDRHGENILFDSTCGDCCHVDFNCLFNRGETFEWPEKVPFRLTHNLIHAMGPLKLEGIFRRSCEVTLRVMRKELDPLMSVLKPFVYDPLVEWSKVTRGQRQNPTESGEITNEQGKSHVQNIENRLRGILNRGNKRSGLALSVEGHCKYLIQEASDEGNLAQMYIGWAAYL